jgi:hypothetical protein
MSLPTQFQCSDVRELIGKDEEENKSCDMIGMRKKWEVKRLDMVISLEAKFGRQLVE